jgi:hypothetical protein
MSCRNGSKDRWVNCSKQIKQVRNTSAIVRDLNGDVFSTLRKGYERLPNVTPCVEIELQM